MGNLLSSSHYRAVVIAVLIASLLQLSCAGSCTKLYREPGKRLLEAAESGDTSRFLGVETRLTDDECLCPEKAFEVIFASGKNKITSGSKLWMLLGKHERVSTVYLHDGIIDKPSGLNWTGNTLTLNDDRTIRTLQLSAIDSLAIRGAQWHPRLATIGWVIIGVSMGLVLGVVF